MRAQRRTTDSSARYLMLNRSYLMLAFCTQPINAPIISMWLVLGLSDETIITSLCIQYIHTALLVLR